MSENWTPQQQQVLDERDKNIIVSAAAGSGKTAVLVERILRLIIEEQTDVDRMLVVTFTNAAASEMREKIIRAITKALGEDSRSADDKVFLRRQLDLIHKANISTFHAFATRIIRKYFHITDVKPDFKLCDEHQAALMKFDAVDEVFMEGFAEGGEEFRDFLDRYSGDRSDDELKSTVIRLYDQLMTLPRPFDWLQSSVEDLSCAAENFGESQPFREIKEDIGYRAKVCEDLTGEWIGLLNSVDAEETAGKFDETERFFQAVSEIAETLTSDNYDEMGAYVNGYKIPDFKPPKGTKGYREQQARIKTVKDSIDPLKGYASDVLKAFKEHYFDMSYEEKVKEVQETYEHALVLKELILGFAERYAEKKDDAGLLDFSDLEHKALAILDHEEVAAECRDKFDYVFVDEYQDTNEIQDTLINSVTRGNNLFMVGDIKQSIYRFRQAEPEIFHRRYQEYGEDPQSVPIDLNTNFRSKSGVINAVNAVFAACMDDYDDKAALHQGVRYGLEGPEPCDFTAQFKMIDTRTGEEITGDENEEEGEDNFEKGGSSRETSEVDEDLKDLQSAEMEALGVVEAIRETLGQDINDGGVDRPIEYRDIVVLMRAVRGKADIFAKVFEQYGIPTYIDENEGYFDTLEISTIVSLLQLVDNRRQDVFLLTALMSPVFGFTAAELVDVRATCLDGSFWDAFAGFACGPDEPGDEYMNGLRGKCRRMLETLDEWKARSTTMELDEFIWHLLMSTGYYTYAGTLLKGDRRQANLRALVDRAGQVMESGIVSIYSFVRYIDQIRDQKIEMGQAEVVDEAANVVRIMTVHKSKGLEFPVVIVAGLGRNFTTTKGGTIGIHKELGVGLSTVNKDPRWIRRTLLQYAIDVKNGRDEMDENIRILYVALTRAKDRLIMVGSMKDPEKKLLRTEKRGLCRCYAGIIGWTATQSADSIEFCPIGNPALLLGTLRQGTVNHRKIAEIFSDTEKGLDDGRTGSSGALYDEIHSRLSYEYPYARDAATRAKHSVTEINKLLSQAEVAAECGDGTDMAGTGKEMEKADYRMKPTFEKPAFIEGEHRFTAAERGTILHSILKKADLAKVRSCLESGGLVEYVNGLCIEMVASHILTEAEAETAKPEMICGFFTSEIGKRMLAAEVVKREQPFTLKTKVLDQAVLVQGIIDCCFRTEAGWVLIDYKSNYVPGVDIENREERLAEIEKMYKGQIALYAQALEKITGVPVAEKYLYLLRTGDIITM